MSITLAVTGATGFVGRHLIDRAKAQSMTVRALTRRPQAAEAGVEWIEGALDIPGSLDRLTAGASAVIHVAGVINARSEAEFDVGNVAGTAAMIAAAQAAGVTRFIHVSSLAAREPALSAYGRSKAKSEALLPTSGLDWVAVRPPAVYGPADRETLELFRMAARGLVLLPPGGRLSVIHAHDLSDLLLALARPGSSSRNPILEPDDNQITGWEHRAFAQAIGEAVGRKVRPLSLPAPLIRMGAALDTGISSLTGRLPKLSFDRARYFCHPDWVVSAERRPDPALWTPAVETRAGLKATAEWYKAAGWL